MKSVKSRFVCFALAFLMLLTCVWEAALPVKAAYENTYKNTGDQRADLIGVALTQVGYREGSNNYTKYGVWYGAPNTAWCGVFVSWCANQAGIPTSVLKKNGFASASHFGLTDVYYASKRTPRPGDLIFKTNNSHVGIVYYVEGNYVYCIEGNTSDTSSTGYAVMIRKRSLTGSYYFAAPKYQSESGSHNYVKGYEDAHPHKEYYLCSDSGCGSKYYSGKTSTVDTCRDCIMANCSHKYDSFTKYNDTYHTAVCGLCTYQTRVKHTWGNDEVVKEATCENAGVKNQTCSQCGATRQTSIPKTNNHTYGEWLYLDNDIHSRSCEVCGRTQEEKHTLSTWQFDGDEHWFTCSTCDGRAGMGTHELEHGCASDCTVCGYDGEGHIFESVWSYDENKHWHNCLFCDVKDSQQEHVFSAACDETCDTCGYVRETVHTYADTLESDGTGHFYRCMECNQPGQIYPHEAGDAATEQQAQKCNICDYELVPKLAHQHVYTPYESDGQTHWGTCQCGDEMVPQAHIWDFSGGICQLCQEPVPVVEEPQIPWVIILPATAGAALLLALIIGLVALKKRRAKKAAALLQQELESELAPV